jgi:putative peptidoglycan lipid II flippase
MSEDVAPLLPAAMEAPPAAEQRDPPARSFVSHARAIGFITFISRLLGMARESIAANYFGAGAVWSAFTVAFTIPNLFRKLFGEGALSAAFIPLYAQAVKRERLVAEARHRHLHLPPPRDASMQNPGSDETSAADFAAASVNLLGGILITLTVVGEIVLASLLLLDLRDDYLLAVRLSMVMLPYVLLICGTAFLGGILQVHHRFIATAATSIVLNLCLIVAIVAAAGVFDLSTEAGRVSAAGWLSVAVLVAGLVQVAMLLPSLRRAGFRFRLILHLWTPAIRRMLWMTMPVALGAGVLQVSVLFDKGISFLLAQGGGETHFHLLGLAIRYPMAEGAAARLNWAQFMYQFPLGVFAIALATAIFPRLSMDAVEEGSSPGVASPREVGEIPEAFKRVLRQGVEAALFIGLPASIGMIVVRYPAVRLLFERGNFTSFDTHWVALSTALYSAAIWAFSLQQILNRAYYSLHDTLTPLLWAVLNLVLNLVIELPLLWTGLGEAALPVGTLVSFSLQSVVMLWMLDRRLGGIGLAASFRSIGKMVAGSLLMWAACIGVQYLPFYPAGEGKLDSAVQLMVLMITGGLVYFGAATLMGLTSPRRIFSRGGVLSRRGEGSLDS